MTSILSHGGSRVRSDRTRAVLSLILLPLLVRVAAAQDAPAQPPATHELSAHEPALHELTTVREIRTLSPDQAAKEQPVRLYGVVTVLSGWKSSFFFQDATAGVSVDRVSDLPRLQAGQSIELIGTTSPGRFAPIVTARKVTVLGAGTMPKPQTVDPLLLSGGAFDSQWATMQGVVRSAAVKPAWGHDVLNLEVDIGGGTIVVTRVLNFSGSDWRHLPASIVSLKGVCGTVFNDRRQFVAMRFFVSSLDDIKIVKASPKDLFDRPLTPLGSLAEFTAGKAAWDPVKVQGTVTYTQGDNSIYVQQGSDGVLVQTGDASKLVPGSQVEVVGYSRNSDYSPSLQAAAIRLLGTKRQLLTPIPVNAASVITERDGFTAAPYDSSLVRLQGELEQVINAADGTTLFLKDGATLFTAKLPAATGHRLPGIGSILEVTGVCFTRVDPITRDPKSFRLLLRSTGDIVILQHGPWWTAENAKTVVIVMALAMTLMAVFMVLYRRDSALRQLSATDPLTGLANRRGFVLLAEQQRKLAARNRSELLVFYIDVDRFKQINDSLGHKQGDVALQTVADILRECFRGSDVIGRLGGDEFAVVACNASPNAQAELTARLNILVAQRNAKQGCAFQLSLSTGVLRCDMEANALSVEELLSQTDELMYKEKIEARSRMATSPVVSRFPVSAAL